MYHPCLDKEQVLKRDLESTRVKYRRNLEDMIDYTCGWFGKVPRELHERAQGLRDYEIDSHRLQLAGEGR